MSTSTAASGRTPKKAAASGWIGSALEYYDFFVYASAASLVFPQLFFPKGNPTVAIMASLATFGVAYVARPLGAFVLGRWGDRHGRKNVLVLCMFLMGASTFLVGCLPSYETIGMWAPILLVILRLMQGFAVSGEQAGANAMILEHAPFGKRGYYCSFTLQGTQAGQIIAAAVFIPLTALLADDAFQGWGWRIPFWMSFVVVLVGYYIRRNVDETPAFREQQSQRAAAKAPISQVFRQHRANLVRVFLMTFVNAVAVTTTVFGMAYATQPGYGLELDKTMFLWIPVLGNITAVLVIPFVGRLSDRIGRRPVFVVGTLGAGVLMYAYLFFISARSPILALITAILMWGIVYQGYNAVFPAFWQELFPTRIRVTAVAIASQIGVAVTGFIPTINSLVAGPGSGINVPLAVGSVVLVSCVLAAIGAWTAPEPHRIPLESLGEPGATPVSREDYDRIRATA
ncbi:MFS transporter [Saccharopolyspora sp. WRP15-2]|uniref:MFS transporter n=1 Tax=Saccharopolyspora oryzae TaxID=2997343 RepID=A0ABT4UWQ2_9PSEU|nr:MFS transporter [Saccharopolyspora oryzae]MDA3626137.1 MFS transporter [Saccharopolyspora oryzae]